LTPGDILVAEENTFNEPIPVAIRRRSARRTSKGSSD
jgi:hypothetical protein